MLQGVVLCGVVVIKSFLLSGGHEQQRILRLQRKMFRKRKQGRFRENGSMSGLCLFFPKDFFPHSEELSVSLSCVCIQGNLWQERVLF